MISPVEEVFSLIVLLNISNSPLGVLNKIDLVFALDTSSSISSTDLQKIKNLVEASLKSYQIKQQLAHIGLVSFGSTARTILALNNGADRNRIKISLSAFPELGGQARLSNLAQHLQSVTFNARYGARNTAPKAVVIITEGKFDALEVIDLPLYASLLSRVGIKLVIVEIGGDSKNSPLQSIPNTPINYISTRSTDTLPETYGILERRIAVIAGKFYHDFLHFNIDIGNHYSKFLLS